MSSREFEIRTRLTTLLIKRFAVDEQIARTRKHARQISDQIRKKEQRA